MKRRRKGSASSDKGFGPRAFTGYPEYRYGPQRKPTLARVFTNKVRTSIVDQVIDEMRDWRITPFENEGPMVSAIRANLCLSGNSFPQSEAEAYAVVSQALHLLGAERPTWEQGQPGYVEPRDNCVWCGKTIVEVNGHKAYQFCSDLCAKAAVEKRDFERKNMRDRMYAAAQRVILKSRTRPRSCAWCGSTFHPIRENSKQACCSFGCASKMRHKMKPAAERRASCTFCGVDFVTKSDRAVFCSGGCSQANIKLKAGVRPHNWTARLFDHFITMPVNSGPRRLTPVALDYLFRRQGLTITCEAA